MGVGISRVLRGGLLTAVVLGTLTAAPKLRLSSTVAGPLSVAVGANGPTQVVEAYNAGDGALELTLTANVAWIGATIGAPRPCTAPRTGSCLPLNLALNTASLAKGIATGVVTVSDPNAVDAPQTIAVTVQMGGGVPDTVDLYVAPNGSTDAVAFTASHSLQAKVTTQSGGNWLSVALALGGDGSFAFFYPYSIVGRHLAGMAAGNYNGSVQLSGPSFAGDNKTVAAVLHVTSQPIAQVTAPALGKIQFRAPLSGAKTIQYLVLANRGLGTLSITGVAPSTAGGGNWLAVESAGGLLYKVTVDPTGLALGSYQGSLTAASNAVNQPTLVPVELEIVPQTGPWSYFGGAVSNSFTGDPVSLGDIVAVFGEQLSYQDPAQGTQLPLVTTLGGATVFVNDQPAPLYFSSYGQINFQMPYEVPAGEARVRVDREGQKGNTISVPVLARAPKILPRGVGDYGIVINNADGTYAMPATVAASAGLSGHPARPGDYLVAYGIGFGVTAPVVASGVAAPGTEPLARVTPAPEVVFGGDTPFIPPVNVQPAYAGLTPFFVGLYQVNVQVPANAPASDSVALHVESGAVKSNTVRIAIQ